MVVDFVLEREGDFWAASCQRFKLTASARERGDALTNVYVMALLELALLAQDRVIPAAAAIEFRVLDSRVI